MFRKPSFILLAFALLAGVVLIALLAISIGRPPARQRLPVPNGYDDFIQAGEAIVGDVGVYTTLDHDLLRGLVSTNAEPLRQLRLGLTRECRMPMDLAPDNTVRLTQLASVKRLAQLLAAEGRLHELENQPDQAARSYVDAIRFGNEISRGGFIITRLVGIACEAIGCNPLTRIAPKLSPDAARAVLKDLDKLDASRVTWTDVAQGERRFMRVEMRAHPNPIMWVMGWWQSRQTIKRAESRHNTLLASERLLTVELALRSYLAEQGHLPVRLDELVPVFLSHVPEDPVGPQPLSYRVQGTNWLLHTASR
jgi:hypothetical protein